MWIRRNESPSMVRQCMLQIQWCINIFLSFVNFRGKYNPFGIHLMKFDDMMNFGVNFLSADKLDDRNFSETSYIFSILNFNVSVFDQSSIFSFLSTVCLKCSASSMFYCGVSSKHYLRTCSASLESLNLQTLWIKVKLNLQNRALLF